MKPALDRRMQKHTRAPIIIPREDSPGGWPGGRWLPGNRGRVKIYYKYIDFSAFESLRSMKEMISREVRRKGLENNIKLGSGGIRRSKGVDARRQCALRGLGPRDRFHDAQSRGQPRGRDRTIGSLRATME